MDYCSACRRNLNGAFVCPGCGAYAPDIAPAAPRLHSAVASTATTLEATPSPEGFDDATAGTSRPDTPGPGPSGGFESAVPTGQGRAARRRQLARWKKHRRRAVAATAVALVGGGLTVAVLPSARPSTSHTHAAPPPEPPATPTSTSHSGNAGGGTSSAQPATSATPHTPATRHPGAQQPKAAAAEWRDTPTTAGLPARAGASPYTAPEQARRTDGSAGAVAQPQTQPQTQPPVQAPPAAPAPAAPTQAPAPAAPHDPAPAPAGTSPANLLPGPSADDPASPAQVCLLVVCLG
ncbi:SCO2400 family protein [Streptomyces sp. NPDC000229]|uniref:SCO2400 family protein n=1 Tax=Streptomyces sp. NPDC000229 TaxID=3154247 RepID=UPI004037FD96